MSDGNYEIGRDKNSTPTGIEMADPIIGVSSEIVRIATTLAAGVEQSIAVPTGSNLAVFHYSQNKDVFVSKEGGALVLPTGSVEFYVGKLRPKGMPVEDGQIVHFISDSTAFIIIEFYNAPQISA